MWQGIVEWWKRKETREVLLVIITGLVVANVRHGLEHHSFDTWGDFFFSWFVHTFTVLLLGTIALAAIVSTHKFFLGQSMPDIRGIFFYIVMTVLVGALSTVPFVRLRCAGHWRVVEQSLSDRPTEQRRQRRAGTIARDSAGLRFDLPQQRRNLSPIYLVKT
jgi:hypothetical protein